MKHIQMTAAAVLLCLAACSQPADTPELRLERAREVAQLEVEGGALDDALNTGADIALAAAGAAFEAQLGRPATEDERKRLRGIFRDALAEFLTAEVWVEQSAAVYARLLTPAELAELAAFYRTSTGTRLLSIQAELTAELGDAAEAIVVENEQAFAERVDSTLATEFPELEGGQ
jgi:hypothetical protein